MISSTLVWPDFVGEKDTDSVLDARVETRRSGEGRLDHTLTLEAQRGGSPLWSKTITFAIDAPFFVPDLTNDDPFVVAALFPAMEVGGTLRFHGTISRVLLRNVLDYQSAWHLVARKTFLPFEVQVDAIDDRIKLDLGPHPNTILAFSGGLDSLLALCRNVSGDAGATAYSINATMLIYDLAADLGTSVDRDTLIAGMRGISEQWKLPMAVVDTNIADVVGKHIATHGTWLASCLSLFSGRFDVGLLGSSITSYSPGYEIYGSHPLLDPLLSGGQMPIRDDEGLYKRPEKTALLSNYPEALASMRVCIHFYNNSRNCCRCEKCIRTMLCFIASGNPVPSAFPDGLDLKDIGIGMGHRSGLAWAPLILRFAKRFGTSDHPAMRMLRQRYRQKWLKVRAKEAFRRVRSGYRPHHWRILNQISR